MKFTKDYQPTNRRKPDPLTARLKKMLKEAHTEDTTKAEAILQTLINEAINGNIRAIQLIYERIEGKPAQSLELLQTATNHLPAVIVIEKDPNTLPPVYEESEIIEAELLRKNSQNEQSNKHK